MIFGARFDAGLGDAALFLRFSRLGQFWDWVAGEAVGSESSNTELLVVEYPNSGDAAQSWYGADVTLPDGGPWTVELVLASTGETVASDVAGALEARTLPAAEYATAASVEGVPVAVEAAITAAHGEGSYVGGGGGGGSPGTGAIAWDYTLTSSTNGAPIADADVWVTTDEAGTNVIASGKTDQNGKVTFFLDAGTVYLWRQKSGWNFTNPETHEVTA
jgi:hypothetical protein